MTSLFGRMRRGPKDQGRLDDRYRYDGEPLYEKSDFNGIRLALAVAALNEFWYSCKSGLKRLLKKS